MENKVLQANIEQINQYNSRFANEILMFENKKSNIELAQNENGEYNLIFNSTILHSTQSTINEAKQIVQNIQNKDNKNAIRIIYGLGLGYLIDEMTNSIQGKIVIYEPNLELVKFALSIAKIDALFNKNVILCQNKIDFEEHIKNLINEQTELSISFLTSYKNLYLDDIKNVLNIAQKIQGEIFANKNTFLKKAPGAFHHTLFNLKHIFSNPNISQLKDIYKGKTAIILCAGPTLKENIEIIKNNQERFVIFALNPTLKLLSKHNIKPDFIVDIENSNTLNQFEGIDTSKHYMILEGFCHHFIAKLPSKKTFNYLSNDNFYNYWVRDCLKLKDNLKTIGTVSYTALMSAYIMGFDKIILIGQDLAYKDGFCYSKECQFGELECIFDENTKEFEIIARDFEKFVAAFVNNKTTNEKAINVAKKRLEFLNQNLTTVKSQNGKLIPTQTGYALFIKHFEQIALELKQKKPEITLINSSTDAAQIDNWQNLPLEKVVENLEKIEKLNLDNYQSLIDKEYISNKILALENSIIEYSKLLPEFIEISEKLLKELKNKNIFTQNALKMLQKFKELLVKIAKYEKDKNLGFIINVNLLRTQKVLDFNLFSDIENAKEMLEKTIKLYIGFDKATKNYLKALRNCKSIILK